MKEIAKADLREKLNFAKDYLASCYGGYRNRDLFDGVETYCMFVGYPRSGHSLVGALLDAHPDAVIAHELDALGYVQAGFGRRQLYQLLLENSRQFAGSGREWRGYTYEVPGQWQGRFRKLRVIGDKKGGGSSLRLASAPDLLDRLRSTVTPEVRYIHVIRNPYDNIATMATWGKRRPTLRPSIESYFSRCEANANLVERVGSGTIFELRHEELVEDPESALSGLCRFLDLECEESYLEACAGAVYESPHKSRHKLEWDAESIAAVQDGIEHYDFLRGYSYED